MPAPESLSRYRSVWWILLGALPFLGIYAIHLHCFGPSSTGFVQLDQSIYLASARAIFERGNGFAYPNPYDLHAPAIFYHWPFWICGVVWKTFGLDPGMTSVAFGAVATLLFASLTWWIVALEVEDPAARAFCFLLVFYGGGLFTVAALISPGPFDPVALDPFRGYWFQNWGRNSIFGFESLYHAGILAVWIALLCRRWGWALVAIVAVLSAHPYTGCTLLAGLAVWLAGTRIFFPRERLPFFFLAGIVAASAAFLWYNFVWLPSHPSFREVQRQNTLPYTISALQQTLALAPVALLAALAFARSGWRVSWSRLLFGAFFISSFLLSNHEWFTVPRMPLHFTRGYVWFPLAMLALPLLVQFRARLTARLAQRALPWALAAIVLVASADNIAFLGENAVSCEEHLALPPDVRNIFAHVERAGLRGTFFSIVPRAGVLAPIYTRLVPYCAHLFLSPGMPGCAFEIRKSVMEQTPGAWLSGIDYLLVDVREPSKWARHDEWEPLLKEGSYLFLRRRR